MFISRVTAPAACAILAVVLCVGSPIQAGVISIDIDGGSGELMSGDVSATDGGLWFAGQTVGTDGAGGWNKFDLGNKKDTVSLSNLVTGEGKVTPISFTLNPTPDGDSLNDYMQYHVGGYAGTDADLRADYVFLQPPGGGGGGTQTNPSVDWIIAGLIPGGEYQLIIFADQYGDDRPGEYDITDANGTREIRLGMSQYDSEYDVNVGENWNGGVLVADPLGQITGTFYTNPSLGYTDWSGLQLLIPEPGSVSLLAAAALAMLGRRRRA
mgnify:CR=1 FL=1